MKKLILCLIMLFSLNIFADEVDKYLTTDSYKKQIVERIAEGDEKAEKIWRDLEDKLQILLEEGNVKAEEELAKWDNLFEEAGL